MYHFSTIDELKKTAYAKADQYHSEYLMQIAHCWHFWLSPADAVIYAVFILFGKIVWHMVDFGISMKTAAEINRLIRNRKRNG